MQPSIYGIRFSKIGKIYHFNANNVPDLRVGEHVVVETSRGRQIGEVIQHFATLPPPPPDGSWKPIERRASAADLVLRQVWQQKQTEAMINCRARASELQLPIKVVAAEFSFDGTRLALLYSTDEGDEKEKDREEKVDLKSLRKDMQRIYGESQVEMRQIGPRDVAKILGGMGACGLETRCCSKFLTEFSPISIKMAKEQGVSLTPTEITGMCGRLRCCLIYEYEQYVEARKELPKRNKRVVTPDGEGKVIDVYPLRNVIQVELDPKTPQDRPIWREFHRDLIEPWDELEALRRKSAAPCDRHENGGCDCGKSKGSASALTDTTAGKVDAIAHTAPQKPETPTASGWSKPEAPVAGKADAPVAGKPEAPTQGRGEGRRDGFRGPRSGGNQGNQNNQNRRDGQGKPPQQAKAEADASRAKPADGATTQPAREPQPNRPQRPQNRPARPQQPPKNQQERPPQARQNEKAPGEKPAQRPNTQPQAGNRSNERDANKRPERAPGQRPNQRPPGKPNRRPNNNNNTNQNNNQNSTNQGNTTEKPKTE